MATEKYVKLNDNALSFHDMSTDLTIARGEVVKLENVHLKSKKVKSALANGHLEYTEAPEKSPVDGKGTKVPSPEELDAKFKELVKGGAKAADIVKAFNLDSLKLIATHNDIEVEPGDTKATIVDALLEEDGEL